MSGICESLGLIPGTAGKKQKSGFYSFKKMKLNIPSDSQIEFTTEAL